MSEIIGKNKALTGLFAVALVFAAASIGNLATIPNIPTWYATLQRPSFTPPNWLFGPVWTTLYIMMAISFWRILMKRGLFSKAALIFAGQLALNAFWSVAFFGMHQPVLALIVIFILEALIITTILTFMAIDRVAAWMLVPYAVWVAYATALNIGIVVLN